MAYAAKPLVEAELAVGRWRATDGVVLLARAATHRKASGSPSFTAWAHSPRARGASAGYLPGCPFTGTPFTASFSRYHVTRKSEWRRLRFPCSLLGVVAMSCPSPRLLVHPPVPRYVWRSPCFASSRRALGLEARACGVQRSPPRSTTCDRGRPSSSTRRGALAALGVQFLPTFPCGGLLRLLRR